MRSFLYVPYTRQEISSTAISSGIATNNNWYYTMTSGQIIMISQQNSAVTGSCTMSCGTDQSVTLHVYTEHIGINQFTACCILTFLFVLSTNDRNYSWYLETFYTPTKTKSGLCTSITLISCHGLYVDQVVSICSYKHLNICHR